MIFNLKKKKKSYLLLRHFEDAIWPILGVTYSKTTEIYESWQNRYFQLLFFVHFLKLYCMNRDNL